MFSGLQRVLVCGSGYGRAYAQTVLENGAEFRLSGLLSRGSRRSVALAEALKTPSYQYLAEIPKDVGIACVAVGMAAASDLTARLLRRGLNVLLEHPVDPGELAELHVVAAAAGKHLYVNYHFAELPAPQQFIDLFEDSRTRLGAPTLINCVASLRTMHSLCDVLVRCGLIPPLSGTRGMRGFPPASIGTVAARVADTGFAITIVETPDRDDGSGNPVGHQVEATFAHEALVLTNTWGPVLRLRAFTSKRAANSAAWEIFPGRAPSVANCSAFRNLATLSALRRIRDIARSTDRDHERHQLRVATLSFALLRALREVTVPS